jgi:hypothetical protein
VFPAIRSSDWGSRHAETPRFGARRSARRGPWLAVSGVVVSLAVGCSTERLPEYRITEGEAYGAPGLKLGNKYWINLPVGTADEDVRRVVEHEVRGRRHEPVVLGGERFEATELTFFVYTRLDEWTKREKSRDDASMADVIYEWKRDGGLRRTM